MAGIIFPTQRPNLDASLAGRWTFDNASANDISGRFNNGTLNAVTFGNGINLPFDGTPVAAKFNGSSSTINLPNIGLGIGGSPRSICAWVYHAANDNSAIFAYGSNGPANNWLVFYLGGTALNVTFYSNDWSSSAGAVPLNTWTHVALVYDGGITTTSTVRVYANAAPKAISGGNTSAALATANANWGIGYGRPGGGGFWQYNGLIDDVRFYTRALSQQEIFSIYNEAFTVGEGEMPVMQIVAPAFISGWSRQSNLPVIGGGTF